MLDLGPTKVFDVQPIISHEGLKWKILARKRLRAAKARDLYSAISRPASSKVGFFRFC
jgi:hypothetical protein